jgi:hypothetical protein
MRIVLTHSKFYDWVPVPSDVTVTPGDVASGKVKQGASGRFLTRVTKDLETHTQVNLPEHQIVAKIIDDKTRPSGGRTLSRKEAAAMYLAEHVVPNHAPRPSLTGVDVHDDGPDEALATSMLQAHIDAGNIDAVDMPAHLAAYLSPATKADHEAQIAKVLKIKKGA